MSTFFEKHGIRADVAEARGYVRWTGCPDCKQERLEQRWTLGHKRHNSGVPLTETAADVLRKAYSGFEPASGIESLIRGARQADGWLMTRHAPEGIPAAWDHVWPEIRPDTAVRMKRPEWHWHGPRLPGPGEVRPDDAGKVYGAWEMRRHIEADSAKELFSHAGVNKRGWHVHVEVGKYLFAPSKKTRDTYPHDHATDPRFDGHPLALARHEAGGHISKSTAGPHHHEGSRRIADDADDNAKRIDVHPLAMPRLADPRTEVVFAVMEGLPKNDAVLSHILRHDLPASVFNIPSVSLWRCPELAWFAETYLVGRTVVIVPDADWAKPGKVDRHGNLLFQGRRHGDGNQVVVQSLLFRSALRQLGVTDVLIAGPPVCDWHRNDDHKGVDDSLASPEHGGAGRSLADLEVLQRTVPENRIAAAVEGHGWLAPRRRSRVAVLRYLSEHANGDGCITVSLKQIASHFSLSHPTAREAMDDLRDTVKAITADGDWADAKGKQGADLHEHLPIITVHDDFRAIEALPEPLGWLAPAAAAPGWFWDVPQCPDCQAARSAVA